ncbi:hypothetical protein ACFLRN_08740 [Thermoproteota archaeon]
MVGNKIASVYEDMTNAEKKAASYLKELNLWGIYEFPVFIYDDKKRPRVWTPDFYISKFGMYIEVCGKQRQDYEYREKNIQRKRLLCHLSSYFQRTKYVEKYLIMRIMEIEDLRHSEIEKMVGQLANRFEPKNVGNQKPDKKIKSCSMEEIRRIYTREYEKWTIEEDQ